MSKWVNIVYDLANNKQEFRKKNQSIIVPCKIGGKYEIDGVLSAGGFGAILLAKNTRMKNRRVLIKTSLYNKVKSCFDREYDNDREEIIENLRSNLVFECEKLIEFRRGGESRMPSIVELIEDFSPQVYGPHIDKQTKKKFTLDELANKEPYLVMQYIDGINLGDYISDGIDEILKMRNYKSPLQWERDVLEYTKDICSILNNFHLTRNGDDDFTYYYIYQDLKPSNIMLTYDKFITLIDFGGLLLVGKYFGEDKFTSDFEDGGEVVGTPGYMAPEMQNDTCNLDNRTDIYTIGTTMYSLLTGQDLTELDSVNSWMNIPVENLVGTYSKRTIDIIRQATSLEKYRRFNSVTGLLKVINSSLKELNQIINKGIN